MIHPENDNKLNEIIEFVEKQETIEVWCKGCEMFRVANSVYAKYLSGEIESCRFCRDREFD
jgi:hypothetical protein